MKPLYLKITEENKTTFIKVVRNGAFATAGFLIRSSGNFWTTYPKMYNLNKEKDKQDYAALIQSCLESNRNEFDEAGKEVEKQADEIRKKSKD